MNLKNDMASNFNEWSNIGNAPHSNNAIASIYDEHHLKYVCAFSYYYYSSSSSSLSLSQFLFSTELNELDFCSVTDKKKEKWTNIGSQIEQIKSLKWDGIHSRYT